MSVRQARAIEVEHRAVVFAGLHALSHFTLEWLAVHFRLRHVEPGIEPLGALLHVAHRVEIFVEFGAVVRAERTAKRLRVVKHRVQHTTAFAESGALAGDAARIHPEEAVEDVSRRILRRWRRYAVAPGEGQRGGILPAGLLPELMDNSARRTLSVYLDVTSAMSSIRTRRCCRYWPCGSGASIFLPREPGVGAFVSLAEAVRVVQSAENGEVVLDTVSPAEHGVPARVHSHGLGFVTCQVMPLTPLGM